VIRHRRTDASQVGAIPPERSKYHFVDSWDEPTSDRRGSQGLTGGVAGAEKGDGKSRLEVGAGTS
jgi:hypothetical protein